MFLRSISPYSLAPKPLFAATHHFSRLHAAATVATSTAAVSVGPHPWPEWVSFVDRLKSRGYFPVSRGDEDGDLVYRDLKLLKDPCLTFARDRFDIFQSLSKEDIHQIVEVGCPKLTRKVVNSAKRLRDYVGLEEKTVCDACTLKGSCNRAYLKPSEPENVRTVDVMRLLLFYALDPMVISQTVRPTTIERADFSAKRLLLMLMDLSESPKDPDIKENITNSTVTALSEETARWNGEWVCPKCSFSNFSRNTQCRKCSEAGPKKQESEYYEPRKGDWNCPKCKFLNFARNRSCLECKEDAPKRERKQVEPKPGDWHCPQCKFLNFAINRSCLECKEDAPKQERKQVEPKPGDWHCPQCNFLNYSRNMQCRECKQGAPEKRQIGNVEPKKGDWDCPQCAFVNFASRTNCRQCTATRPPQRLNTGEWVCSKCSFLNFRRNATCLKCDGEQVKDAGALHAQHVWKKPIPSTVS